MEQVIAKLSSTQISTFNRFTVECQASCLYLLQLRSSLSNSWLIYVKQSKVHVKFINTAAKPAKLLNSVKGQFTKIIALHCHNTASGNHEMFSSKLNA